MKRLKWAVFGGCVGYLVGHYAPIEVLLLCLFWSWVWTPRLLMLLWR